MDSKLWELVLRPKRNHCTLICRNENDAAAQRASFDNVIIPLHEAELAGADLRKIIAGAYNSLRVSGQVCVIFSNKYSWERLFGRKHLSDCFYSFRNVLRELKKSCFMLEDVYVLEHSNGKVTAISKMHDRMDERMVVKLKRFIGHVVLHAYFMRWFQPAYAIVACKGTAREDSVIQTIANKYSVSGMVQGIVIGKPSIVIVLLKDIVMRLPLERLGKIRCRYNSRILAKLKKTGFAFYAPNFLGRDKLMGYDYFCESKLSGMIVDIPVKYINDLVLKAVDFIINFHRKTFRDIVINESHFRRLFSRDFKRLRSHLCSEFQLKLDQIETELRGRITNKPFKVVWTHGDYKLENILFDVRTKKLNGVIDWDLSRVEGLPLLDIFYILLYNDSVITNDSVIRIFNKRFLKMNFSKFEKDVIDTYLKSINLSSELIKPMQVMFWITHVVHRHSEQLLGNSPERESWLWSEVCPTVDNILNSW